VSPRGRDGGSCIQTNSNSFQVLTLLSTSCQSHFSTILHVTVVFVFYSKTFPFLGYSKKAAETIGYE